MKTIKKIDEIDPGVGTMLDMLVQDKIRLDVAKKGIEGQISAANTSILTILQSEGVDKVEGHGWNISQVAGANAYLDPTKVKEALLAEGMQADKVMSLIDSCTKKTSYTYPSVKTVKGG
jgi:hypothetical protein